MKQRKHTSFPCFVLHLRKDEMAADLSPRDTVSHPCSRDLLLLRMFFQLVFLEQPVHIYQDAKEVSTINIWYVYIKFI